MTNTHDIDIRAASPEQWMLLKQARLSALLDTPTAFAVKHDTAAQYSDATWRERATPGLGLTFWLAFHGVRLIGLVGSAVSDAGRCNLIGMWIDPAARGSGAGAQLIGTVKAHAAQHGLSGRVPGQPVGCSTLPEARFHVH